MAAKYLLKDFQRESKISYPQLDEKELLEYGLKNLEEAYYNCNKNNIYKVYGGGLGEVFYYLAMIANVSGIELSESNPIVGFFDFTNISRIIRKFSYQNKSLFQYLMKQELDKVVYKVLPWAVYGLEEVLLHTKKQKGF